MKSQTLGTELANGKKEPMKSKFKLATSLLLFISTFAFGQMEEYRFKRELIGISGQWNKLVLPDDIFGKITENQSDIRVYGITAKDTIEAPYLIRLTEEKVSSKEVAVKTLNVSRKGDIHFYTFEIPTSESINQINLEFKQDNFDWKIKLEGSQNQQEWFTVADDYRILSIKNELANFQFTKLTFPNSKYPFFRLRIESKKDPGLVAAKISQVEVTEGGFKNYPIKETKTTENKQSRQTEIEVDLQQPVPISKIKFAVADRYDFYRPFKVMYLTDSVKTEQGWKHNYRSLASGTLNSLEENEFKFSSTTVQKLRFIIDNQDNQPLSISTIQISGYVYELLARMTESASYFLVYGNNNARKPQYDIARFASSIPEAMTILDLGEEQVIEQGELATQTPLFQNKLWLWSILILAICILGWFSIQMLKKK